MHKYNSVRYYSTNVTNIAESISPVRKHIRSTQFYSNNSENLTSGGPKKYPTKPGVNPEKKAVK